MRYVDLRALFINCTLKRSPELSHTQGLVDFSRSIMEKQGVHVDVLRAVDHDIATGVWPDMTEHGWASDEWPQLFRDRVLPADILVIAGPIWLGDNSSVTKRAIERLYACSSLLNASGQYAYYGRVGGCLITGNEDGVKHCAMNILYSLQHHVHDVEPAAPGPHAQGQRRGTRTGQPAQRMGCRLPLRLAEPGVSLMAVRRTGGY